MALRSALLPGSLLLLSACASGEVEVPLAQRIANALPAVAVQARGETEPVGTSNADAADDPAIWRNPADPAASLIVGTDKKAGLYVYGLDGRRRDFLDAGRVNNVDLRDGVTIDGTPGILVVASDRNDLARARLALFRLDPATAKLSALGTLEGGAGEAYGVCLGRDDAGLSAFIVLKDGTINQVLIDAAGAVPRGRIVRTLRLGTQSGVARSMTAPTGSTSPRKISACGASTPGSTARSHRCGSHLPTARRSSPTPRVWRSPRWARTGVMSSSRARATMPMSSIGSTTSALSGGSASSTV